MDKEAFAARKDKLAALIREPGCKALTVPELAYFMQVPARERDVFQSIVDVLLAEGLAVLLPKGKLMPPERLGLATGIFLATERGFGFVSRAAEGLEDVFVPAAAVNGARHKDMVLYRLLSDAAGGLRAEGEIFRVLNRGIRTIVGTYAPLRNGGILTPDEKRLPQEIFVPRGKDGGAVAGHKVVAKIIKQNADGIQAVVEKILGHRNDPGVDVLSIVEEHGIPWEFPETVLSAAANAPEEVMESDILGRADFRALLTVTIDGDDAKDLDDAVSLETLPNGHVRLGVHIADVSHYVKAGSALDEEAYLRGTSVYLVDRVIPMLPHRLSNGICSLNPQVDRLALSCLMEFDGANVVSHHITTSVIRTAMRLSYDTVNGIITSGNAPADMPGDIVDMPGDIVDMLHGLSALSRTLRAKREARGAMDFNLAECRITLDEHGRAADVQARTRNDATGLIEECMLICNETVAEEYFWLGLPFVYRVHEEPDEEKLAVLADFAGRVGHRVKGGLKSAKALQSLLTSVRGTDEEALVSRTVLRSMKQARYTGECTGHFGLAAKYYCHFTSPIRRYPDLTIHRVIKAHLASKEDSLSAMQAKLPALCAQCSSTERRAEQAEREADNMKKAEYMENKVGQVLDGIISGVTAWGVFIELPNTVEGLVPRESLPNDEYEYDEKFMRLVGRYTGRRFSPGNAAKVRCIRANAESRRVEFAWEDERG